MNLQYRNALFAAMMLVLATHCLAQTTIRFARYPAPSPDGKQIAFSWQGDLWLASSAGGEAKRLTVHEGYDFAPIWSPDGTKIAFTSDRYGNDDVFVLHLRDGAVQRLTHWSGRDRALGWTPDGKAVLFESTRDWEPYGAEPSLYVAPLAGGTPYRLHNVTGTPAALSPDGEMVAFVRRDSSWWRKGYKGSATGDLWLHALKTGRFTRLTQTDTPDTHPMWSPDGKTLYFLSERDGTYNLWAMHLASKSAKQLTRYRDDGVRFPHIARNGSLIAYEQGMDLCTLNPATGEIRILNLTAPAADVRQPQGFWQQLRGGDVSEFAVAPNGKEVAFVVRGEVFVTRYPEGGPARRLTETVEPEYDLAWSPDSKSLVFASERGGTTSLYLVTSDDPDEPRLRRTARLKTERLTRSPQPDTSPVFSPDGKKLAFRRGNGDLMLLDMEKREERTLLRHWNLGRFVWSPDSRWLAFEQEDNEYNSDIYLLSIEEGKPVNISRHPNNDTNPSWSADGRAIAFLSQRDGRTFNICYLFLRKADDEKSKADWQDEEDARHDAPKKPEEKPKDPKEREPIQIDFEDIHDRVRQVTRYVGGVQELALSPDGKKIAFRSNYQGQSDLYVIDWDGGNERRLTTGGASPTDIRWSADGNQLTFLSRGRISRIPASGGSVQSTDFTAQMRVDLAAEREYIYDAVWRTMAQVFYDERFHGTNWEAMRGKYRAYLPHVSEERDFSAVVYMMLGELNSSHVGFTPRQTSHPESTETGMLGVVWANTRDGEGLLIEQVIPNTPAVRSDVNLKPGERVLAVNGRRITPTTEVWQLLNGTVGEKTELLVRAPDGKERTVTLRPISPADFRRARYEAWVKRNQKWVEEKTGGELGYVHIQGMGELNVYEFIRQLHAVAYGKKGLIIDVRFNGGGWTTDYLLAILMARRHAYTLPRGGEPGYPQDRLPLYVWTKPIAVLCNERSFSNAEIFTHAIKTLKRGPVIGMPTAGGVISTGRRSLIDGSSVATPGRGWFTIDKGVNMEGNGAVPDHLVEDLPEDMAAERDRQLEKAVEVLSRVVKEAPPEFPHQAK
ncbi:MAG: DPP IV N-terminal domain-containing protein [Armatimonadota bacterium]|nr:DPP IV N-terminal domain-containing protein [Armatimonadota bacterium]